MKLKLAAPALVLALAGTGAFAQGIEGHQIGYTPKVTSDVSYSTRNAPTKAAQEHLEIFKAGQAHAEDFSDVEVTVYPTLLKDVKNRVFTR